MDIVGLKFDHLTDLSCLLLQIFGEIETIPTLKASWKSIEGLVKAFSLYGVAVETNEFYEKRTCR